MNSKKLFAESLDLFPGGVNSPVRAFGGVGGTPVFFHKGKGAWFTDVGGKKYLDYVLSWGPLALGHAHPKVVRGIRETAGRGTSFGAPHPLEMDLARLIQKTVPGMEKIRFVSSGTEAAMSAIRLARAFSGRSKIVKFEGGYHGHADSLLVRAGSGVATLGLPDSPGVTPGAVSDTLTAVYNDIGSVNTLFSAHQKEIAAVIVEPVAGNMGVIPPVPGFLEGLRKRCSENGSLLIFDEVMTGFRVHPGGAQALFGVKADLVCLGKVIGGGLPAAAYGGRKEIMDLVAPAGSVYQAGTLSGNPLAMRAGLETLRELSRKGVFEKMSAYAERLSAMFLETYGRIHPGSGIQVQRVGGMFTIFFSDKPVRNFHEAKRSDQKRYARFFHALLKAGIYFPPSALEACFVSSAHGGKELDFTRRAIEKILPKI